MCYVCKYIYQIKQAIQMMPDTFDVYCQGSSWHFVLTFISLCVCGVCACVCMCVCVYVCVPNVPRRIVKPDIFDIVGTGHFK